MATKQGLYDVVVVTGDIITVSPSGKASLMLIQGDKCWMPNSQFVKESIQDKHQPERWTMFIPRWLAEDKELDYQEEDDWIDEQADEEGE